MEPRRFDATFGWGEVGKSVFMFVGGLFIASARVSPADARAGTHFRHVELRAREPLLDARVHGFRRRDDALLYRVIAP